ncbi:MAG: PAS domain S-box protein [Alteromonadales bacterium]|nr:PAS domain S-box protein [Alteromonadales bacterium]
MINNILYIGSQPHIVEQLFNSNYLKSSFQDIQHVISVIPNSGLIEKTLKEKEFAVIATEQQLSSKRIENIKVHYPNTEIIQLNKSKSTTENKQTFNRSKLKERLQVFENSTVPFYLKDKQGTVLACNSAYSKMFRLKPSELIGNNISKFTPHEIATLINANDREIFDSETPLTYEHASIGIDGEKKEYLIHKELIDTDTQFTKLIDIRKFNADKRILDNELQILHSMINSSTDLIFLINKEGKLFACNKQMECFLGKTEAQLIALDYFQLFSCNKQAEILLQQDKKVLASNQTIIEEVSLTNNVNQTKRIRITKVPHIDSEGVNNGIIVIGKNITKLRQATKELKISNLVFDNSLDGIIVTDANNIIISCNDAATKYSGYSKQELIHQDIRMLSHNDVTNSHSNIADLLRRKKEWSGAFTFVGKDSLTHYAWLDAYLIEFEHEESYSIVYSVSEINNTNQFANKIKYMSSTDPITGIANRISLLANLDEQLIQASYDESSLAVLFIKPDFSRCVRKNQNNMLSDSLLKKIAHRLKEIIRKQDFIARFDDDTFVIVLKDISSEQDAATTTNKILNSFNLPIELAELNSHITLQIGISLYPDDGITSEILIDHAKDAMLAGNDKTKSNYCFYTQELTIHTKKQLQFESEIEQAIENNEFVPFFKHEYELSTKKPSRIHLKLFWNSKHEGLLKTENFYYLAQETELIHQFNQLKINLGFAQATKWNKQGLLSCPLSISLDENFLKNPSLMAIIQQALKDSQCPVHLIEFEVSESILNERVDSIMANLLSVKKMGFGLIIKDYASTNSIFPLIQALDVRAFKVSEGLNTSIPGQVIGKNLRSALHALTEVFGLDILGDQLENHPPAMAKSSAEMTFYLNCNKK